MRNGRLAVACWRCGARDSLLIEDGRIRWIGDARDAPSADRVIDLQGSRLVAGLTDAHVHLFMRAQELMNLELGPGRSDSPCIAGAGAPGECCRGGATNG